MANAYDALLAQFYTPADRQQTFFESLAPLGAGLIAAGSPSTNPAAFGQGMSHGLLGMQQTLRQGHNDAFRRAAITSQLATADLQRQQLQAKMAAMARVGAILGGGGGVPAPSPAGMPGGIPTAGQPGAMGGAFPPPTAPMPGPISGPPAAPGGPGLPSAGGQPQAAPTAAPGAPATNLQALASRYFQVGAELMAVDPAQGRAFIEMAMQYNPAIKVEMTAAGDLLIKGPDGKYYSAPGVDAAKARRAGGIAGAEAGARNASELRYAGPIAAAREQGKNQGAVAPVTVYGTQMPGTEAVAQTTEAGKARGSMTLVQTPWGVMPQPQAVETAKNFAGRDVDTTAPGTTITRIPPALGPQPSAPPRQEMTDSGFGMSLPGRAPAPPAQPQIVAQNPTPHPQSREGMDMKNRAELAGKEYEDTLTKAKASAASLRSLQAMRDQIDKGFTPGPTAPMRATASAWLQDLGVREGLADRITGAQTGFFRLSETQTLALVQDIAKTFGANPSNYEGQQLAKAVAQTTDPKAAYQAIVDYAINQHRRNVETWLQQEGARKQGVDAVDARSEGMRNQLRAQDPLGLLGGRQ